MKKILITGGSKGIGLECVKRFTLNGWQVITCSRIESVWVDNVANDEALKKVEYHICDVSIEDDISMLFKNIKEKHGHIDAAINNASPAVVSEGYFKDIDIESVRATINSDLWSTIFCLKQEMELLSKGGSIVNITSINGLRPIPGAATYGAAKQGIESLTKSLALEAISNHIRINSIAPGPTWTPRWEKRQKNNPEIRSAVEDLVPMKRFASPDDIANAAEWLISDSASYIVGHTLVVDGGLSLT